MLLASALLGANASCGGCVKCEYEDFTTTCRMTDLGASRPDPTRHGWVEFTARYERDRARDHGALSTHVDVHVEATNEQAMRELLRSGPPVPCSGSGKVRGTCSPGGITKVDTPRPGFATVMELSR